MTTALITGVTGQDGTLLARRLVAEGLSVHGVVRAESEVEAWRPVGSSSVSLHFADITDEERLTAIFAEVRPDEVYNLAGISSVAFSWERPVLTGAVTGVGAVGVFEAAWRLQESSGRPVRVAQASSAEIFGVPDRVPQDEATSIRPVSPYGAAKAYAHLMAGVYRSRGLHVATCIFYNHESPLRPQTFVTRKITAAAARIAVEGGGSMVLGNLAARRDWGWAEDYVDALVRATRHDVADEFVVATGHMHSVAEFAAAALRRAGVDDWESHVEVDTKFNRPVDAAEIVGDASKAARVLGWAPTVPFEELVGRMVDHDLELLGRTV
ncbi:MAG: GDP-mannose 4,6-dehydratase [Cellulomonadaceae bacterium]|nr:GDP-mannose 4,6-dehydratase [Cellulomonadaceae bacterium]